MQDYSEFLETKKIIDMPTGFEVDESEIHESLFDFQKSICSWAVRRGRAAVFTDTGTGKGIMQISVNDIIYRHTQKDTLILAPLAVVQQTYREAKKLNVNINICRTQADVKPGINITNYEMLSRFDRNKFISITCDESGILKGFQGATRKALTEFASVIPYRLAFTATPSPNDLMEIANHAEFLGIMSGKEIMALFFIQDGNTTHKWRLKNHGKKDFFRWLASWAVAMRNPRDLGFNGDNYDLPALNIQPHILETHASVGRLFAIESLTLSDQLKSRKETIDDRVDLTIKIINQQRDEYGIRYSEKKEEIRQGISRQISYGASRRETFEDEREGKESNKETQERDSEVSKKIPSSTSTREENTRGTGNNQCEETRAICCERGDENKVSSGSESVARQKSCEEEISETSEVWNNGRAIRGDVDSAGWEMRDMRVLGQDGKGILSDGRSLPYNGKSAGNILHELQPWIGEIQGQSGIVNEGVQLSREEPWVIWCTLNSEQDLLEKLLGDRAISIHGSLSSEEKTKRLLAWLDQERPILISKPSVTGFGVNMQLCSNVIFVGVSHSFEQYYQAIRRCWRFGQKSQVNVHIVTTTQDGAVVANLERKEREYNQLMDNLVEEIRSTGLSLGSSSRDTMEYAPSMPMILPDWLKSCDRDNV